MEGLDLTSGVNILYFVVLGKIDCIVVDVLIEPPYMIDGVSYTVAIGKLSSPTFQWFWPMGAINGVQGRL